MLQAFVLVFSTKNAKSHTEAIIASIYLATDLLKNSTGLWYIQLYQYVGDLFC